MSEREAATERRIVVKAALRVVPLDKLEVDHSYQRGVKDIVKKIIAEFNKDALGIPLIGQRGDGRLFIVDGQQRITALRTMGWPTVRAEVFASDGEQHEAAIFKLVNLHRAKLTVGEQFRSLLTAKDEMALAIKAAVEAQGYTLFFGVTASGGKRGKSMRPEGAKQVACLTSLLGMARRCGVESISFALRVVDAAWPGDRIGLYNYILSGLGYFWKRRDGIVDEDRLIVRLRGTTPYKVLYSASMATTAGEKSYNVANELDKIYKRRANPRRGT